ncbi:hypothetical protein P5G50_15115 [Leifsonia sp. F6_8S_P_1B]|uniref:Transmembrane protein n=1 Tax=Leifsonia williamsii TaxID=3035919 RepID=A0ABT8KG78_9MICO|nr:hypothetical protein [Leifsonia williamsii]MDN4615781.1 hypothetical protein [Leifsonia williamsii]
MEADKTQRMRLAARTLPAVCILLSTWLLMWLALGLPTLCALAYPCPAPDVRVAPTLLFGGLMLVPAAALVITARGDDWGWVRTLSYIVIVGLAVVGLGVVLFSGGFTIPLTY